MDEPHQVFVSGGTGYIGRAVLPLLIARGHRVRALARTGSEGRLPAKVETAIGNALDGDSFSAQIAPCDTFLHLVGVAHPSPSKAQLFRQIDLASAKASGQAARAATISHFVYISVAQPAPAMKDYVQARAEGEAFLKSCQFPSLTCLRPWYVLGPGHRWPYLLLPGYWVAELFPPTRDSARRLGLVTLARMAAGIVQAIENPPDGVRIVEVPEFPRARLEPPAANPSAQRP